MNRPAAVEITYECMRFLITHNPTNSTLNKFTEVSVCESACVSERECLDPSECVRDKEVTCVPLTLSSRN